MMDDLMTEEVNQCYIYLWTQLIGNDKVGVGYCGEFLVYISLSCWFLVYLLNDPALASSSAASFPATPRWPGTWVCHNRKWAKWVTNACAHTFIHKLYQKCTSITMCRVTADTKESECRISIADEHSPTWHRSSDRLARVEQCPPCFWQVQHWRFASHFSSTFPATLSSLQHTHTRENNSCCVYITQYTMCVQSKETCT